MSAPESAEKRTSAVTSTLHAGMVAMKNPEAMTSAMACITNLANIVEAEPNNLGFDVFYLNAPWKNVDLETLQGLPLDKLCNPSSAACLFMWVDGSTIAQATDLLSWWSFEFHSVIHCTMYVDGPDGTKTSTPHGWDTDGLNTQRVRQLWYCIKSRTAAPVVEGEEALALNRTVRDPSFVRRRMPAFSSFQYTRTSDYIMSSLSSKKKGVERWTLYPDMCAFSPSDVEQSIDKIIRPNARVLHLFADSISQTWFSWGPNVPAYIASPMRGAESFDTTLALCRYFTGMRLVGVQRYMSILNLYAVSLARKLGGKEDDAAMSVVETRLCDFFVDVHRRFTESGGSHRFSALSSSTSVTFDALLNFKELDPIAKTGIIRLAAQIVAFILARTQEAAEKKAEKRKAAAALGEEGDGNKENVPPTKKINSGRHGIAAPVPISAKLASFMGLGENEHVARTAAVRFINKYISSNNLQNPGKRSEIVLDGPLRELLNPPPDFGAVTYFGMSKLLVPHFPKTTSPPPVTEAQAVQAEAAVTADA